MPDDVQKLVEARSLAFGIGVTPRPARSAL
jgi:hypothetical protein